MAVIGGLVGSCSFAGAHEGEDHGAPTAPVVGADAGLLTVSAVTEGFEVVLKHGQTLANQSLVGTLYLSDYATNTPIAGARVGVEATGSKSGAAPTVVYTGQPGIYRLTVPAGYPANGHYELTLTLTAGDRSDLILLNGLSIGPVAASATPPVDDDHGLPWGWIGLGVALIAALIALGLRARSRRSADGSADGSADPSPWPTSRIR